MPLPVWRFLPIPIKKRDDEEKKRQQVAVLPPPLPTAGGQGQYISAVTGRPAPEMRPALPQIPTAGGGFVSPYPSAPSPRPLYESPFDRFGREFKRALSLELGETGRELSEKGRGIPEFSALLVAAGLEAVPGGGPVRGVGRRIFKRAVKPVAKAVPEADVLGKVQKMWKAEEEARKPGLRERFLDIKSWEEKITDRFARINQMTTRARREARKAGGNLAPEVDAEMQAALTQGVPEQALQEAVDVYRSVAKTIGPKISADEVNTYLHLRHSIDIEKVKGPQRLIAGGVKGAEEAQRGLTQQAQLLGPEKMAKVEQAADLVRQHYITLLDKKVAAGLVAPDVAETLKAQYPWYNPIAFVHHLSEVSEGVGGLKQLSVTTSGLKKLTELGSEAARERPLDTLVRATMQSEALIQRNKAATAIIRLAEKDPKIAGEIGLLKGPRLPTEKRGTLSVMESGIRKVYEVPRWLEEEAKAMEALRLGPLENGAQAINQVSRFGLTTGNLAFFVPNIAFDTLTAFISKQVGPLHILVRLAKNLRDTDPVMRQLRLAKGGISGFWGRTPEEIISIADKQGAIVLKDRLSWTKYLKNPFRLVTRLGHAVEMAPRTAVFEKEIRAGRTAEQAALAARRSTVDFARGGTAVRQLNAVYLYLNASVQGATLPFRVLRDSPKARWALGTVLGADMGLYTWNRQFPEYEDVPDYVRYGAFIVMLPSEEYDEQGHKKPHYALVVPNLREWSLFHGPLTYFMEKFDKKATADFGAMLQTVGSQSNPISQIVSIGGGLAGLIPTILGQTLVEITLNKDTFRDRPIVPPEMANLPLEEQYTLYTSEFARRVGPKVGLSPLKLEYFFQNALGGVGRQILSGADAVLRKVAPEYADPRIIELALQLSEITPPHVAPQDVSLRRERFLNNLSVADRKAVLEQARKPKPGIPILEILTRRIYRTYGGALKAKGRKEAAETLGLSEEETASVSRTLSKVGDELDAGREDTDRGLMLNRANPAQGILPKQWRDEQKEVATLWRGALLSLGLQYPMAAQVKDKQQWAEWMTAVNTLAGAIPDLRTKGQLLRAAWGAIEAETDEFGIENLDEFFERRDQFWSSLSGLDQELLKVMLQAGKSPLSWEYWEDTQALRVYWDLDKDFAEMLTKVGVTPKEKISLWLDYRDATLAQAQDMKKRNPVLRSLDSTFADFKNTWRIKHRALELLLLKWGYVTTQAKSSGPTKIGF